MVEDIITVKDLLLTPVIIFLIYVYAIFYRNRKYKRHSPIRKYFLPALTLRFVGCFLSAVMYQYYYHGGDTFAYMNCVKIIHKALWEQPLTGLEMIFNDFSFYSQEAMSYANKNTWIFSTNANALVPRFGALIGLFTISSYLSLGMVLAFFSFLGCWKLFEVFYDLYPHLHKRLAIATLFIPSVYFWGSAGLLKDTITTGAIGFFVWGIYYLFIKQKKFLKSLFYLLLSSYLLITVKIYIMIALAPATVIWIFLVYESKIRNKVLRFIVKPVFLIAGLIIGVFLLNKISTLSNRYNTEAILDYAITAQTYIGGQSGSSYDLGKFEPTILGLLKIAPFAINVTLFRPYPWETSKAILIPSALEAIFTLFLTIYVLFKIGLFKTIKRILGNPNILFCLVFALTFAFAVGFSTYNFGALARYKIPCLPFYFIGLFLLLDQRKRKRLIREIPILKL